MTEKSVEHSDEEKLTAFSPILQVMSGKMDQPGNYFYGLIFNILN